VNPNRCSQCGHVATRRISVEDRLADLESGELRIIRLGASRYYVHKLAQRYPEYEWTAERSTLYGGADGAWNIYAQRKETVS
jgi:hypothetical protein